MEQKVLPSVQQCYYHHSTSFSIQGKRKMTIKKGDTYGKMTEKNLIQEHYFNSLKTIYYILKKYNPLLMNI